MPVIDKYKQIQENIQLKKNTPLQDKVDEIQKKVDEQNRQKALQNVANVQNKTELANADNLVKRTGMTTMYNTSSNPPQTPGQQVAAQNLQNKGIDPTKLGTGTGESYQPYTPTTQPTEPVTPTTTTVTPLQQKVDAIQKQVDANNEAIKQGQVSPIQQKLEQDKLNRINSKVSLYSNGESLYNAVQGGSILPGTQEWTTLAQTKPEIIQQYDVIKKQKDNYNQVKVLGEAIVGDVQPPQPSNALQNLLAYFQKDLSTDIAGEYQNTVINNPAYQGSVQKFNDINQQIADNNKNIQALRDDVRKKYSAGTPESLIASAIAREARPLIEQGQYLSQLQANAESEMTRILEENKSVFEMKQQERTQKNQRMMELYGTIRSEEIRQEDMARADKLLADEIARTDKKDKEKLAQLEQERLDNVKTAIAQLGVEPKGETYDELLGEYATAVKSQPVDNKPFSVGKDSYVFDPATGEYILPPGATTGTAPAPSRTPTIQSSFTPEGTFKVDIANGATPRKSSRGYYECAMLVNDTLGTAMPDLHTDKLKYNNSNVPVVGGAFIEKTNDKYGHTGIIESINADGTLNIVETNYPVGSGVTRKTIDPNKRNIVGYYDPEQTQKVAPLDSNQRIVANTEKSAFRTNPVVKAFEEGLQQYQDIVVSLEDQTGPGDTAGIFQFMKSLDPNSVVRETEFEAAAKSAGVAQYLGNTYDRIMKGKKLSQEQALAFKRLAKAYVENRSKNYDRLYEDMARSMTNQGIDPSYLPTRATDVLREKQPEQAPQKKNIFTQNVGGEASINPNDIWQ